MVSPAWFTGFASKVIVGGSNANSVWQSAVGDVSIDSTVLRDDRPTLRTAATTTQAARLVKGLDGTSTVVVNRTFVLVPSVPGGNQNDGLQVGPVSGNSARVGWNGGKFRARFGTQTGAVSDLSWTIGSWALIEWRVNLGVTPMTIDWRINGVEQTQAVDTSGQAPSAASTFTMGTPSATDMTWNFSDPMVSYDTADYGNLGESSVIPLMPAAAAATVVGAANAFEATTNTGAAYTPLPAGAADLTSYITDLPLGNAAKYVRQVTAGAGNYLTVPFADTAQSNIRAVRAVLAYGSEAATGTSAAAASVVRSDATEVAVKGSSTLPVDYAANGIGPRWTDAVIPAPAGGWTTAEVNALAARLGAATDVTPQPRWHGIMLELDVVPNEGGGPGPAATQHLRPTAITGSSGGTWTGTAADIAEATPNDATAIVSPASPTSGAYEEVQLAAGADPGTTAGFIVHIRRQLQGPGPMDLTVELRNASTVVASWTYPNISSGVVQTNEVLTSAQAAALAPYNDIRLRFLPNYIPALQPPIAVLTLTRVDGRTVTADWSGSAGQGGASLVSATVAWSDGSNTYAWPGTKTANHTFPATPTGNRTITVTVTDSNGQTATDSAVFSVQSAVPPTLSLTRTRIDENSVTASVVGTTAGTNPIDHYTITWGDGSSDTLPATGTTVRHDYAAAPLGFKTITGTVFDTAGLTDTGTVQFEVQQPSTGGSVVLYAAGDIAPATSSQQDENLAAAIQAKGDAAYVLTLGDNQYPDGLIADFRTYYDNSFGRFPNTVLRPLPGNHDHHNNPYAAGYRQYFITDRGMSFITQGTQVVGGVTVQKLFYYFDPHPNWRVFMLDSEITTGGYTSDQTGITEAIESVQLDWLDARLAELVGTNKGVIFAFHRERYSSDTVHGSYANTSDLPYQFYARAISSKVDVVLVAHVHAYERFNMMNNAGAVDTTNGVRQILTGTGGNGGGDYPLGTILTGSQVRFGHGAGNDVYGATRLVLTDTDWSGSFIRSGGAAASDSYGPFNIRAK